MLSYDTLWRFKTALERDQAPRMLAAEAGSQVKTSMYDLGGHIYSVSFNVCAVTGEVDIRVHVQVPLLMRIMHDHPGYSCTHSASDPDTVHVKVTLVSEPKVEYISVLFKEDLERLWAAMPEAAGSFPENMAAEDIWVQLRRREVLGL